jgi:hypothetical protein
MKYNCLPISYIPVVYALDRKNPSKEFEALGGLAKKNNWTLDYREVDVQKEDELETIVAAIAKKHGRLGMYSAFSEHPSQQ